MIKGCYIHLHESGDQKINSESGVYKKIESQCIILNNYFLNENKPIKRNNSKMTFYKKILIRLPYASVASSWNTNIDFNEYDYVYIRKELIEYSFIKFLKLIRKTNPKIKIILEIPTYPYDQEIKKRIFLLKDKVNRKKLIKYIDRIVTYSQDDMIFGIPTIQIINGIDFNKIQVRSYKENKNSSDINLISVAVNANWHGYDRVIKGLGEYYKNGGKRNINYYLVGEGVVIGEYKRLVEEYNLGKNVIFTGAKSGKDLDDIYDKCDIALDAMGRHRSGVYYNSTLKGKEYLAKGIPIISGVTTELDNDKSFKYYLRVPANDKEIDMNTVIEFYEKLYCKGIDKEEIIRNIRNYGEKKFSMHVSLKPVIEYIEKE